LGHDADYAFARGDSSAVVVVVRASGPLHRLWILALTLISFESRGQRPRLGGRSTGDRPAQVTDLHVYFDTPAGTVRANNA
jgi:hypothetical protein